MVNDLPITNDSGQDLRLGVRPTHHAALGPGHHEDDYLMGPGAEWCIHAPGENVTFAIQVGRDVLVVLVGGCDFDAVRVDERIVGERPLLAELPRADEVADRNAV